MLARRGFLLGLIAAPAVIRTPGLLMPVKAAPKGMIILYDALGQEIARTTREVLVPSMYIQLFLASPLFGAFKEGRLHA